MLRATSSSASGFVYGQNGTFHSQLKDVVRLRRPDFLISKTKIGGKTLKEKTRKMVVCLESWNRRTIIINPSAIVSSFYLKSFQPGFLTPTFDNKFYKHVIQIIVNYLHFSQTIFSKAFSPVGWFQFYLVSRQKLQ